MQRRILILVCALLLIINFAFATYNEYTTKQTPISVNNQTQQAINELKKALNNPYISQEQKAEIRKTINELEQFPAQKQEYKQEYDKIVKEQEKIKNDRQKYIANENKKREEARKNNFKVITWNGESYPGLIINNVKYFIIPTIKFPIPTSIAQGEKSFNEQYYANTEKYGCKSVNSSWVNSYEFPSGRDVEELIALSNNGNDSFSFHYKLGYFKDTYRSAYNNPIAITGLERKSGIARNRGELICRIDYPVTVEYDAAGKSIVKIKENVN